MSEQIKDGGPAFPVPDSDSRGYVECSHVGMTLRDYFAAKAMQGMLSSDLITKLTDRLVDTVEDFHRATWLAVQSYGFADAMIAAREAKS